MRALGLDIGGANIKAALLSSEEGFKLKTLRRYFPIWREGKERLSKALELIVKDLAPFDSLAVTMTAELSDVFRDKSEGVKFVLDSVGRAYGSDFTVLSVEAKLLTPSEAKGQPLKVASANWAASGWLAGKLLPRDRVLVVDVGSTTTSITPVDAGVIAVEGLHDVDKLKCGELVYSGALRTNVAAVVNAVPVKGILTRVSSEYFATTGDVHMILGNISQDAYSVETADGRGKDVDSCMARLARAVCGDATLLSRENLRAIAKFIHEAQVHQIALALLQVLSRLGWDSLKVLAMGIGSRFLAGEAAARLGLKDIIYLEDLAGEGASSTGPAFALACMLLEEEGFEISSMLKSKLPNTSQGA